MDLSSRVRRNFLFGFLVVLVVAYFASAQTGTTSLQGTVADKTGAVIVGAKITLSNAQQGLHREATTNSAGEYEFLSLPPGTYALVVEMTGFRKSEQRNLQLLVNLPTTSNVVLEVGTSSETVEVSAQTETLNTTDASLGNTFNDNQAKQLPLKGRTVPNLSTLKHRFEFSVTITS